MVFVVYVVIFRVFVLLEVVGSRMWKCDFWFLWLVMLSVLFIVWMSCSVLNVLILKFVGLDDMNGWKSWLCMNFGVML